MTISRTEGRTDIGAEVDPHALLSQAGEVLAEGAPVGLDAVVIEAPLPLLDHGVIERRHGVALAGNFRGDALKNLGGQPRVHQDGDFRLPEHVDESRRHHQPADVDGPLRLGAREVADGRDVTIPDGHIGRIPRRAGAIDDAAVRDDEVILIARGADYRQQRAGGQ